MITSSFEAMDLAALKAARSEIQALITKREGQEAAALREEFKKRAEQAGLDVALVLGRKTTRRSRPKPKSGTPRI